MFAKRLKNWRSTRHLPLKHMATDLGVSMATLSQWENGHRFPTMSNLETIARYMDTHVCCLLYDGDGSCHHRRC